MSDYLEHVIPCDNCGERWCLLHELHWYDCPCPGPHEEDDDRILEAELFKPGS